MQVARYGALIVWSDDLGGPLNQVIIPVASASIGFTISVVAFLPLSLFAERCGFRRWLPLAAGVSVGALVAVVTPSWIFLGIAKTESQRLGLVSTVGGVGLYLVGGFFLYLCCLAICRTVLP